MISLYFKIKFINKNKLRIDDEENHNITFFVFFDHGTCK